MLDVYKMNSSYRKCCEEVIKKEKIDSYVKCCAEKISENDYLFSFEETGDEISEYTEDGFYDMIRDIYMQTDIMLDPYGNLVCLTQERLKQILDVLEKKLSQMSIYKKYFDRFILHKDKEYFLCIVPD